MHHERHGPHDPVPIIFMMEQGSPEGTPLSIDDALDLLADDLWQALTVIKGTSQLLQRTLDADRLSADEREIRLRTFLQSIDLASSDATRLATRLVALARANVDG